ncbi:MAG: 4Fe-4S binding protein [Candidatus Rokubacteria bacterium]|nr:4Fe-4S binding protein [Candidatus Rokubacteria bacterium]
MPATLPTSSAAKRILPTLNQDGTRRWLRPKLSRGRFLRRRRVVAWVLVALFTLIPYLRMGGKPLILLDVTRRQFTLFGTTFLPTDTALLMLLLVGLFLTIFWLTAVYGRVWCGWACPQTVYMEFLYRPVERLIEGGARAQSGLDGRPWSPRRLLKHAVFLGLSMFLAHTFLAYFVGVEELRQWVTRSPLEHPAAFLVMATTTALMFVDFGWFREQVCIVACPYGRLQSVLLDRRSLIVGYDQGRGEPRATYRQRRTSPAESAETRAGDSPGARVVVAGDSPGARVMVAGDSPGARVVVTGDSPGARVWGDCIDCGACVVTCPTGIDIRQGLQMECIHCTQCMDACDAIMARIGRPRGLIRYSSKDELAGAPRRLLRPRIVVYPALVLLVWGVLGVALAERAPAEVTVLRGLGSPFTVLPSGEVSNQLRVKIVNLRSADRDFRIELTGANSIRLVAPENPLRVAGGQAATATVFLLAPRGAFAHGRRDVRLRVEDGAGFGTEVEYRLIGPDDEDDDDDEDEEKKKKDKKDKEGKKK